MTTFQLFKKAMRATAWHMWFSKWFWQYLLEKPHDKDYCSRWHRFWCRAAAHPAGYWYYNSGGCEPDWTCKECGDDIQ